MNPNQFVTLVTTWAHAIENLLPVLIVLFVAIIGAYAQILKHAQTLKWHTKALNGALNHADSSNPATVDGNSNSVSGHP